MQHTSAYLYRESRSQIMKAGPQDPNPKLYCPIIGLKRHIQKHQSKEIK